MSRSTTTSPTRRLRSVQQRGIASLFDFLAEDIDWEVRPDLPDAGRYQGHDGVRRLSARFDEVTDDRWYRPEEFVPVGDDQVVVPLTWGGRGKGSGLNFEERRETWVLTVRAGKIVRIREFATREIQHSSPRCRWSAGARTSPILRPRCAREETLTDQSVIRALCGPTPVGIARRLG
jgi:ketosteroid isomerase-like protein